MKAARKEGKVTLLAKSVAPLPLDSSGEVEIEFSKQALHGTV